MKIEQTRFEAPRVPCRSTGWWLRVMGTRLVGVLACGLSLLGASSDALACGGCFSPPSDGAASFVTSHRMAFSISAERTVLWDQFSYSGSPEDFSWVLPVAPGAFIELAEDAFLEALDQVTAPTVYAPPTSCFRGDDYGGGCGCGLPGGAAAEADASGDGGYYEPPVVVVSEQTVGPYDTVVLRSTDDRALVRWLEGNDYVVPPGILPIIDAYVSEGYDFLALRLSPGNGVDQMTPVRVVTPGGPPMLPLRMVAAGVGAKVQMTLFVLSNTPMQIPDLSDSRIQAGDVTWDYSTNTSNYDKIVAERLAENEGHVHLTTYAQQNPFTALSYLPGGFQTVTYTTASSSSSQTLDELYFRLAGETGNLQSLGEACARQIRNYGSSFPVTEECEGASCPGSSPTGLGGSSSGGEGGAGSVDDPVDSDPNDFVCGGFTDIQAALVGHIPRNVWLTRLDMDLPRSALERDCALTAAEDRSSVDPHMEAGKVKNDPCAGPGLAFARLERKAPRQDRFPPWSFGVFVAAALWCRRRTRGAQWQLSSFRTLRVR